MKLILILSLCFLSGCHKNSGAGDLNINGLSYKQTEARAFGGQAAIESSFVRLNGEIMALFDPNANGSLFLARMTPFSQQQVMSNARFTYVFEYGGSYYNFTTAGDVYLWKSDDLVNWRLINNGEPVLTRSAGVWTQIWNVGVGVDASGIWHLLAETNEGQPDQAGVGLAHATGVLVGETITFNKEAGHVLPGGNPYLKAVDNGLLIIHGVIERGYWTTAVSKFDGTNWIQTDKRIGIPNVHVCDPAAIDTPTGSLLSVSVDQNSIYLLESPQTLEEIYKSF
jgi:hypothetical protein